MEVKWLDFQARWRSCSSGRGWQKKCLAKWHALKADPRTLLTYFGNMENQLNKQAKLDKTKDNAKRAVALQNFFRKSDKKVDRIKLLKPLTTTEVDRLDSAKEVVDEKKEQNDKKISGTSTKIIPKNYSI